MKKTIAFILLFISIVLSFNQYAYAKDKDGHNKDLDKMMFAGKEFSPSSDVAIERLELAAEVAIDQYNGSKNHELSTIRELYAKGQHHVPDSIQEINYTDSSRHRRFTHRGWDFVYTDQPNNCDGNWQKIWLKRRDILLYVSNQLFVFDDDTVADGEYTEKCNSFCALVYYIHIIGDHENDYSTNSNNQFYFDDKMGVGGLCDKAALGDEGLPYNNLNVDIIDEIIMHSNTIFTSKKSTTRLFVFKNSLRRLDNKFKKIVDEEGKITDSTKYKKYIKELEKILEDNLYYLLLQEDFFNNTIVEAS